MLIFSSLESISDNLGFQPLSSIQPNWGQSSSCENVFYQLKHISKYYTHHSPDITPMNMEEVMNHNFPHARYNYNSNLQYQEYVALETEILPQIDGYIIEFQEIKEMLMNMTTSGIQESLVLVETLLTYFHEIIDIGLIYNKYLGKLDKACNWIRSVMNHQGYLLRTSPINSEEFFALLKDINQSLDKIRNTYIKLRNNYVTVNHLDNILQSYVNGNIIKFELGKKLRSMEESWDVLYHLKEELETQTIEYSAKMTLAKDSLAQLYELYLTLDFPLINRENVYELELVKKAAAINDSRMQELVTNLKVDIINYLPELIKECFERLIKPMEELKDGLVKPIEDVLKQFNELSNDLEIYQTSTKINKDFFM